MMTRVALLFIILQISSSSLHYDYGVGQYASFYPEAGQDYHENYEVGEAHVPSIDFSSPPEARRRRKEGLDVGSLAKVGQDVLRYLAANPTLLSAAADLLGFVSGSGNRVGVEKKRKALSLSKDGQILNKVLDELVEHPEILESIRDKLNPDGDKRGKEIEESAPDGEDYYYYYY